MFFRLASFPSLNSLKLRPKLILAFAAISMMAGLCGSVGLFFVDRISASVGVFSDVTSPLQVESMALVENARRMRTTLFRALDAGETGDQLSHSLLDLHAESQGHLAALRRLAERTSVDIKVDAAEQREREFVQVLERMMAASGREQTASAITKDRLAQFDAKHRAVTGILLALANRAEGELNRAEDQAKVQVQTGAATVDGLGELISGALTNIYPVVQNANKLMRETEQIDEAAHLLLAQTDQMRVAEIERDAQDSFKMIVTLSKKLAGRLRDADGKAELAKIQQGFADLEASVLGPQGLFGSVREALEARAEVTTGRASIEEIDRAYLGILDQVERAVAGLNRDARQQAANSITQARTMIAAIIVLTVLAGLTLAVLLARRITGPLTRLADHVVDIRKSGKLDTRIDPSVTDRGDEIGTLSRAFNLMIAELADARRRLIAWS
jgi:HAMP domain-containing protein